MKKKAAAILVLLTFMTGNVYASVLGSLITSWFHDIATGTQFFNNTFLSSQSGVGKQTEYYAEYTPNDDVRPAVVTGGTIWGSRTIKQAEQYMRDNGMVPLIGVNASFFSFKTGVPMGHVISDGKIMSKDTLSYPSIGFLENGSAFIAPLAIETTLKSGDREIDIAHINKYNQTATDVINLYTDDFGDNNQTSSASLNLIIGGIDGILGIGKTVNGVIEEKFNYAGAIKIPEGKMVITLNEIGREDLYMALNSLEVGDEITISSNATTDSDRWSQVDSGLGSEGAQLIKNGEVQSGFEKGAAPRTAVGITENGNIIFYVIDGRQIGHSYGVQVNTLAQRMKEFGCVDAINLDGGGSTAISGIYPGSDESAILNSPSEGSLRKCTNYIFLKNMKKPTGDPEHMYLYPFEQHYLSGYSEELHPVMTDSAYYKMDTPDEINYYIDGTESIMSNNVLTAVGTGEFTVNIYSGAAAGSAKYHTYETPTNINVYDANTNTQIQSINAKKGDIIPLNMTAQYYYIDLKSTNDCFNLEVDDNIGYIDAGKLVITSDGGSGKLRVSAGEYTKEIAVNVENILPFGDISSHWAKDNIIDACEKGIVSGYSDATGMVFKPNNNITREEFAVIMCRFLDIDAEEYNNYKIAADDADKISAWSKNYVGAMEACGLMNGKEDGGKINFAPQDKLTRAEAITILGRVIGGEEDAEIAFADSDSIPNWAKKHINIMVSGGFVKGYEDNTIKPNNNVTRAEAVTMICSIMNKSF